MKLLRTSFSMLLICILPALVKTFWDWFTDKLYYSNKITQIFFEQSLGLGDLIYFNTAYFSVMGLIYVIIKAVINKHDVTMKSYFVGILYSLPIVLFAGAYIFLGSNIALGVLFKILVFFLLGLMVGFIDNKYLRIFVR
jgi:hypothetical protein